MSAWAVGGGFWLKIEPLSFLLSPVSLFGRHLASGCKYEREVSLSAALSGCSIALDTRDNLHNFVLGD